MKNEVAKWQFLGDLIRYLSETSNDTAGELHFDDVSINASTILGSISNSNGDFGFTGIYLNVRPKSKLAFRVMRAAEKPGGKVLNKFFTLHVHGVDEAFNKAVQARAEFVGFTGQVPSLQAPSDDDIKKVELTKNYS